MQILVTGSNGQLGSEIRDLAPESQHEFIFTDVEELDICNEIEVQKYFDQHGIDLVLNCAAYTAVDQAESEIDKALLLNAAGPSYLAESCRIHKAVMIHISTDFVFSGQNCKPYHELDPTGPVNVYGQTKLEGENRLIKENSRSIIIRTSWLYSSYGKNFVKTMVDLGKEKDSLNVIYDQIGTPTYANDLATLLLKIISHIKNHPYHENLWGIYHYSNEGVASWYDLAYEIFRIKDIKVDLRPVRTSEYTTPAARPHFSVLDKEKIKTTFQVTIPHWKESLMNCLSKIN